MVRGLLLLLCVVASASSAATPQRTLPQPQAGFAFDSLYGIAAWLRVQGREGYIGADVADAMGIARPQGEPLVAAWQRGFKSDDVLRIAQVSADDPLDFILFTVQRPDDRVYFYHPEPQRRDAARAGGGGTALARGSPLLEGAQRVPLMEPERINQIASRLADLQARSAELRRYL